MRALTIRQPWASLIIEAGKDIENRSRATKVRGWVLVHAGATWSECGNLNAFDFCRERGLLNLRTQTAEGESERVRSVFQSVPQCGGIIGAMHIADCVTESASPWFTGPFGWVIDQVVKLPFLPCKGAQGWFNVELPPAMVSLIPS